MYVGGKVWTYCRSLLFLSLCAVKRENAPAPPSLPKPALTEAEVEKKAHAIIEEYLHINDLKVKNTTPRTPL